MTLQQYIESISRVFPAKGQVEITLDINNALREFAEKSKVAVGMYTFNFSTGGVVTGTDEAGAVLTITQPVENSGFFSLAIASNIIAYGDIKVYGTDSQQMASEVFYETNETTLRVYNGVSINASIYASIEKIELSVIIYPATLSALSSIPTIPIQYHRALESHVLALYYRRQPMIAQGQQGGQYAVNINMARALEDEFNLTVVQAKRHYFLANQMGQTVADGWNY